MWKFQITLKFAYLTVNESRRELCKFLGYLKFPHQPYKKWPLKVFDCLTSLSYLERLTFLYKTIIDM